jgi:formamidopyrimidine-DNA glycosylase
MPELPEVETIKTELSPYVIGHSIKGITLLWEGIVRQPSVEEFRSRITGQKIVDLARRGKYLLVSLSQGDLLIIHLKMTGALLVGRDSQDPPRFTRAIIHLDRGVNIFFRDPRKFGLMRLVKDKESVVGELGPEPLEPEFTPDLLQKLLARRQAPIKALLCDQNFIAGIGNMYADEALFAARIYPLRTGASLTRAEIQRLHKAIRQVLRAGIGNKGASVQNYYRPDGTTGTAHFEFKVAHGRGQNCPNCGTPIERITVRGRGTYFCPRCQPAP